MNKWKTNKCGRCGEPHEYIGKIDLRGIEYVICMNTCKRMNVSGKGGEGNSFAFPTIWIKEKNNDSI